jgi:hypothetical protein
MFEVTLPPTLIVSLLVGVILPLIVGLVTTRVTNSGARATLLAALAAATGLLTELGESLTAGTPYDIGVGGLAALAAFLTGVGLHFGLYKPTGAASALQRVGSKPLPDPRTSTREEFQAALDDRDDSAQ